MFHRPHKRGDSSGTELVWHLQEDRRAPWRKNFGQFNTRTFRFDRKRKKIMKKKLKAPEGEGLTIEVLLVEDSPGDVRLMQEVFRTVNKLIHLQVASDGVEAMAILRQWGSYANRPRPDLILLDLNLPKMDGREVLALIKEDASLKTIPTAVLTMSELEADIENSYQNKANCYLRKPVDLMAFENLVKSINDFWLTDVKLPRKIQSK